MIITQSSMKALQRCPYYYYIRYVQGIDRIQETPLSLRIGTAWHRWLEGYWSRSMNEIDTSTMETEDRIKLEAMTIAYRDRYAVDDQKKIKKVQPEMKIRCAIPGRRKYHFEGIVDALIDYDGTSALVEHKTTSAITGDYLDKLWSDLQIHLYAYALQEHGVCTVLYDVIEKCKLKMKVGETEEEYQVRRADLITKSKTGKTSAQRQMPESEEAFRARVLNWYKQPDKMVRQELILDQKQVRQSVESLYQIAGELMWRSRYNVWTPNYSSCQMWGRECKFAPICRSHMIDFSIFEEKKPHLELEKKNEN